jgi:hypothetical protein
LISSGSPLGFRNILINGDFRVNQRGFNGTWSGLSNGDYGFDRWKKSDSDIQQVVEAGNFVPSAVYILSGTNVTTTLLTAPSSGNWTITVPNTATNIQLELGRVATPFERRPIGLERALCERYYQRYVGNSNIVHAASRGADSAIDFTVPVLSVLRAVPTVTTSGNFVLRGATVQETFSAPAYLTFAQNVVTLRKTGLTANPTLSDAYTVRQLADTVIEFSSEL